MWQRFTERARKVVFYAQEEAQTFGEGYVSTEHLLLGLVREGDSLGCQVLERMGVSLGVVRGEVEKQLPRGEARSSSDMTLTPRAKRVIDLAYEEARNLNNNYIGTEHLLLGFIRERDGLAGRVLEKLGVRLELARVIVIELQSERGESASDQPQGGTPGQPEGGARYADAAKRLHWAMQRSAAEVLAGRLLLTRQGRATLEQLALLALSRPGARMSRCFESIGYDKDILTVLLEARTLDILTRPPNQVGEQRTISEVLSLASDEALAAGKSMDTEHILLAVYELADTELTHIFSLAGLTNEQLRTALRHLDEADAQ